ncbi:MAG: gliding motility lipoprotein GldH [Prevotellaceae bacterium]|jgi:gliding motility-associated lipoprotein GldH|nr:gliding motility lipoprotein GldH [Prevotellaceae bacterium]
MTHRNTHTCACLLAAACAAAACAPHAAIERDVLIPNEQWHKDSAVYLAVPIADTAAEHTLILTLRHHDNYPYRNIYLLLDAAAPDGTTATDTLQYELADRHGCWMGATGYHWIDHRLLYRTRVRFARTGEYHFCLRHGMRTDVLTGVRAVGIRLETPDAQQ